MKKTIYFILITMCLFVITCKSETTNKGEEESIPTEFSSDTKIPISSSKASESQSESEISKSYDNDFETVYHSRWNQTKFPVTLTYNFTEAERIDYATIYPRKAGSNGHLGKFDVYVTTAEKKEYLLSSFDFGEEGVAKIIPLGIDKPLSIQLVVNSGFGGFVCFSEIMFYKSSEIKLGVFTDKSFSELKEGTTLSEINSITNPLLKSIAEKLFNNTYEGKEYKIQTYKALPSASSLARNLKLNNGYSRYENITGIFLKKGENIVMVSNTSGKSISLLLPDLMRQPTPGYEPTKDPKGWGLYSQMVPLKEGVNIFNVEKDANAYISYYDDKPETCPPVRIHFPEGIVNGYFDTEKHDNSNWDDLLANAKSSILDAKGKYIHLAYPVNFLKQFASGKGVELVQNYDKMLLSHYTFMGLIKYNKVPTNRIFARVNFNYYMFRDIDGVAYLGDVNTMRMVVEPNTVISGDPCWGFCHETGHVLQMIPQMTWGGMMEVSNNILTLYTTTGLGNESRLKESGAYNKARKSIIDGKISYLQDKDVFNRLVPFWQLHLYFSRNGKPDFYGDIMEQMRNRADSGTGNHAINNQFEFIKLACDVGQTDLTDFFDKWGFFYEGKITVEDYGSYNYTVTKKMVDETKAYIADKKYAHPSTDITLIED